MKRIVAILILLLMFASVIVPVIYICINNSNRIEEENITIDTECIITYEVTINEVIDEEPDQYELAIQSMRTKLAEIECIEDNKEWFLAYKDIVFEYEEWIDPPETIYDYFSDKEINLICCVVETETYQCDFDSKVNVANVVFNRLECGEFGETIEEVITSKNQFAYGRKNISEDTVLAVEYAFMMEDTTQGALFFHSNRKTNKFCGNDFIFQDEAGHNFY